MNTPLLKILITNTMSIICYKTLYFGSTYCSKGCKSGLNDNYNIKRGKYPLCHCCYNRALYDCDKGQFYIGCCIEHIQIAHNSANIMPNR